MEIGNPAARLRKDFLEKVANAANMPTGSIRVSILLKNKAYPQMVNGRVLLPTVRTCGGPVPFARSWLHELQHANDFRKDEFKEWTLEEIEARARAVENLVPEEQILELWKQHQANCYK